MIDRLGLALAALHSLALVSVAAAADAPPLPQPDLFIGTLAVDGGHVVLTRCDLANTRYVLQDVERNGPVSQYAAGHGEPAYGEVLGSFSEHEGQYALSVTEIDNIVIGKSCHLMDIINEASQSPVADTTLADLDLASLVECRSDVATALKVRTWLGSKPNQTLELARLS